MDSCWAIPPMTTLGLPISKRLVSVLGAVEVTSTHRQFGCADEVKRREAPGSSRGWLRLS